MDTDEQPAGRAFLDALRKLYEAAGYPSTRKIAADAGLGISHTTVHQVLRGQNYPTWRAAVMIITALGGTPVDLREEWEAGRPITARSGRTTGPRPTGTADLVKALAANTEALDRLTAAVADLSPCRLPE